MISPAAIAIAVTVAVFALFLLLALLWLFVAPLRRLIVQYRERLHIKQAMRQLALVDAALAESHAEDALRYLRLSVVYEVVQDQTLLDLIRDHHQNVLSRCVLIAEALESRPEHLAEVEQYFLERSELLDLLVRAKDSYQSIRSRRAKEGKGVPSWSRTDFESRIKQIETELDANLKNLKRSLGQLFGALSSSNGQPIVYH